VNRSLRDAAAALEAVGLPPPASGDRLETAAEALETSTAESLNHADQVRAALVQARERLRGQTTSAERAPAFEAALVSLAGSIEALNASRPLLEQEPAVSGGFRALTNAIYLAADHPAPFTNRTLEPRAPAEVLEHARAEVLALGRSSPDELRDRSSRAMYSIAELVEAMEGSEAQVAAVRAEARRIEHDRSALFARTDWIERGLSAALDALHEVDRNRGASVTASTQAAQRATSGLTERGALPFEHAEAQDAFRATLDAFGMALLAREACGSPSRPAPSASAPTRPW